MVQLNGKLKASTLIESLVAMVIIITCLGVSSMIYSNVLNSDNQRTQLKAMLILSEEAIATKTEKSLLDSEKQIGDWTIKKTVESYPQSENVFKLSLTAINKSGKIIAIRNELIIGE